MEPLNLAKSCGPLPTGGEYAGNYRGNLTITVMGVLSLGTPAMRWGVRVEKPTTTKSGRAGKPERVTLLVATKGESPADLLRQLATMWDVGEVVPGETYDDPAGLDPLRAAVAEAHGEDWLAVQFLPSAEDSHSDDPRRDMRPGVQLEGIIPLTDELAEWFRAIGVE